jgi:hypothetical protein
VYVLKSVIHNWNDERLLGHVRTLPNDSSARSTIVSARAFAVLRLLILEIWKLAPQVARLGVPP